MYTKKVLIFSETDGRFASFGRQLCGMTKLVYDGGENVEATVFVTNADTSAKGEWWVIISSADRRFARKLDTFDNCKLTLPKINLDAVGCLLVFKQGSRCYVVGDAFIRDAYVNDYARRNAECIIAEETGETAVTDYEKFVAATGDFYGNAKAVNVESLKRNSAAAYKSVTEYSSAFERYYAAGRGDNYYQSVKSEINKLFTQFPPYFPLINKYKGSFFVRIDFPSSDKFFVLGLLEKDGEVKYICYGLPGDKEGFSDKDFTYVDNSPCGFWMLYQDADTGQITTL
ncbi:MAG: hypothetical protein NC350_02355 [Corallococcus sp.]|nr:hypothetical protein [Corallococcus sp.]